MQAGDVDNPPPALRSAPSSPVELQAGDYEVAPARSSPSKGIDLSAGLVPKTLPANFSGFDDDKQPHAPSDAEAQYGLGLAYKYGDGVPVDYTQSAIWLRKAAEQGNADAQFRLGGDYAMGEGVPQDSAQEAIWYRKAAEQGNVWAQYWLGVAYEDGQGVPQDYMQAEFWYAKAANQGKDGASEQLIEVQHLVTAKKERQRERRHRIVGAAIGAGVLAVLGLMLVRYRKKFVGYTKTLIPQTTHTRQLAVLLPVATWCSACCLYQAFDPRLMRHPINAAVTALLLSSPALIFGGVALWWLSQNKQND